MGAKRPGRLDRAHQSDGPDCPTTKTKYASGKSADNTGAAGSGYSADESYARTARHDSGTNRAATSRRSEHDRHVERHQEGPGSSARSRAQSGNGRYPGYEDTAGAARLSKVQQPTGHGRSRREDSRKTRIGQEQTAGYSGTRFEQIRQPGTSIRQAAPAIVAVIAYSAIVACTGW